MEHEGVAPASAEGNPSLAGITAEAAGSRSAQDVGAGRPCCEHCAAAETTPAPIAEQFVYSIGQLDIRFPTLGIEREFQQCLARTPDAVGDGISRGAQIRMVLETHGNLAMRVCYVLMIGGVPAYIVAPTGSHTRFEVMDTVSHLDDANHVCVLIGRRGPMAPPHTCGGILAPIVAGDQLYSFSLPEWYESLETRLEPALAAKKSGRAGLRTIAPELFGRIAYSTENLGATDSHRTLNYALIQHPGIFLAALEVLVEKTSSRPAAANDHTNV